MTDKIHRLLQPFAFKMIVALPMEMDFYNMYLIEKLFRAEAVYYFSTLGAGVESDIYLNTAQDSSLCISGTTYPSAWERRDYLES